MMHPNTTTLPSPVDSPGDGTTSRPSAFVPEIQGLRTIALLLVATFHIWFGRVSGGVDIFLLVSAYLMTRSLVDAAEAGRRTRPVRFVLRKFARLMPAAAATVLITMLGAVLFTPMRTWTGVGEDAIAAVTYTMNWRLQSASADYFNLDHLTTSAFQQFWSLSIQGQVFVLWPLIHLATEGIARLTGRPVRPLLTGVFGVICVSSFAFALHAVAVDPSGAYFDSLARLWEFAVGSLLALLTPRLRLPARVRAILATIGLIGVVSCGFVMPEGAAFPGVAALWPVLSAAAVIIGATGGEPVGAGRLLAAPVLRRIGGYTYALYLIHWPLLIIGLQAEGRESAGPLSGLAILVAAAVGAFLITRFVERPVAAWVGRERPWQGRFSPDVGVRTVAVILACTLPVIALVDVGRTRVADATTAAKEAAASADYSTLGAMAQGAVDGPILPDDLIVRDIWTESGDPCDADDPYLTETCVVRQAEGRSDREIVVLGNSHSMHFNGMVLETLERRTDWTLRTQVSPGCTFHYPAPTDSDCDRVMRLGTEYVVENAPDLVIVIGTLSNIDAPDSVIPDVPKWITDVVPDTTQVVVLRDSPRFDIAPYECGTLHGFDDPSCLRAVPPIDEHLEAFAANIEAIGGVYVDLDDVICPDGTCRPVIGGVVTYVDTAHLSEPFSRSLAQIFTERVRDRIEWWPQDTYSRSA